MGKPFIYPQNAPARPSISMNCGARAGSAASGGDDEAEAAGEDEATPSTA